MFDSHVHLQDSRYAARLGLVLAAAAAAGVEGACCCGTRPADWEAVAGFQGERGLRVVPAFGVHPWYVADLPPDWPEQLEEWLRRVPAAAVGEIGMDGLRREVPHELQRQVLARQLELACRMGRPVVLHGASAWGELLDAARPFAGRLPGLMAHAFAGSAEVLSGLLTMGACVSFAGSVCNPQARRVAAAAAAVPADRLLAETDSPDIFPAEGDPAPGGADGERLNHPANLIHVLRALSELRGELESELAARTQANALRLFRLNR